jgi:type I restriction enzyme S subunit
MARAMKESGVEWIGEIPEEWEVIRLKYVSTFVQNKYSSENGNLNYVGLENIVSWSGMFTPTNSNYDKGQSLLCEADDILFGKLRPYLAKVYVSTERQCCSGEFSVIRINKQNNTKFFWFQLISHGFIFMVDRSTYGTKMPRANGEFIKNMFVAVPSVSEQKRISTYLNAKIAAIDAVLEKTRASIEEYKKLKQAVITEAVTKGIRGDRPMKDSGIAWIGEIPEEWEVRRIKTLFDLRDEKNYLPLEEVNLISLYTDLGVVQHSDLDKTTGNKASNADGYKKVYEDDIVVNIILCWMGAIGRSAYQGVTSPAYDIYVPKANVDSKFYHHYFRTSGFSGDCYKRGKGIMAMRWRTYSDQFRDIKVVYPPIEEQREILEHLDERCSAIDALISKKTQFLTELETYKKSLIYEVVTGKREVLS